MKKKSKTAKKKAKSTRQKKTVLRDKKDEGLENYLSPSLLASIRAIEAMGNPLKVRKLYGTSECSRKCGKRMKMYSGDPRARGWFRVECKCGYWGDTESPEAHNEFKKA